MSKNCLVVVIPFYNGFDYIEPCLASLEESDLPPDHVLIVDNSDQCFDWSVLDFKFALSIEVLKSLPKIGFGRACNVGIWRANQLNASSIVLLNQDSKVEKSCLKLLNLTLTSNSEIAITFPLSLNYQGNAIFPLYARRYLTNFPELIYDLFFGNVKSWYNAKPEEFNGSCVCLRAEYFIKDKLFDPLFLMYGEDGDLFKRISKLKYRFYFVPLAKLYHEHSNSSKICSDRIWIDFHNHYLKPIILKYKTDSLKSFFIATLLLFLPISEIRVLFKGRFAIAKRCFLDRLSLMKKLWPFININGQAETTKRITYFLSLDCNNSTIRIIKKSELISSLV